MEKGVCSGCRREEYIQNKTKILCPECVYKRSHEGKTRQEVQYEKQRSKSISKRSLQRSEDNLESRWQSSKISQRCRVTGEKEMFLEIWGERPHYCTNPKCRKFLGNEPKVHYFSHIKPKSVYPELRLEKTNIRLLCFQCHYDADHRGIKIEDE